RAASLRSPAFARGHPRLLPGHLSRELDLRLEAPGANRALRRGSSPRRQRRRSSPLLVEEQIEFEVVGSMADGTGPRGVVGVDGEVRDAAFAQQLVVDEEVAGHLARV